MPFLLEVVVDIGVERGEFLQALHLPEPEHRKLKGKRTYIITTSRITSGEELK